MALWCRNVPVSLVPRGTAPKPITFVYPFYANHQFLAQQLAGWCRYPGALRAHLTIIVVDDGSPVPATIPSERPCTMRLFRIERDVRWNWLAARNIGAHYAADGWLVLTDMDHVIPAETLDHLVHGAHDPHVIYAFQRREHTGVDVSPHSASFLLTRAMFWRVGGYDEALSGCYGTDGDWRRRCGAVAPLRILPVPLVRHEFVADASTTTYGRKEPQDARVRELVAARGPMWTPRTLSFPYHEVTL